MKNEKQLAEYVIKRVVDMITRPKSLPYHLLKLSIPLWLFALGGTAITVLVPDKILLRVGINENLSELWTHLTFLLSATLIALAILLIIFDLLNQRRKKIIIIEQRGLRDTSGTPLDAALPYYIFGKKDFLLQDVTQVRDGIITDPDEALRAVSSLPIQLKTRFSGLDRKDISFVYGGLMPVPYTFLTGMLIDDENQIFVMDWDRATGNWRTLDGLDDGNRFEELGLDQLPTQHHDEVVLAVSVSYKVDMPAINRTFSDMPKVILDLPNGDPFCHWSIDKQQALAQQFLASVIKLESKGIKKIHLIIAAQNSVVFQFGRAYDKRNLPALTVYQYEKTGEPPYPWGVKMPTHGSTEAIVKL